MDTLQNQELLRILNRGVTLMTTFYNYLLFGVLSLLFTTVAGSIIFTYSIASAEEIEAGGRKIDRKAITHNPEIMEKAKQAIPKDMSKKVQDEINRLTGKGGIFSGAKEIEEFQKKKIIKDKQEGNEGNEDLDTVEGKKILAEGERVYIFISSSVPIATLRNYASAMNILQEENITMVMRGFVDGMKKMHPTLDFVRKIIVVNDKECKQEKCETYKANIMIEPRLFSRFNIDNVPAIVYDRGAAADNYDITPVDDSYYVVYGDTSIDGAIEIINKEAKTDSLPHLIKKIRGSFYLE
ncbi:MAG: hypothetical protein HZB80_04045 [Deltaproteobacteria bacterium]|nr:hypothetical protein [Deltaproteobacteria bacterium]